METGAVVSWIAIETTYACQWEGEENGDPIVCVSPATWEEVRAAGVDGLPIDVGRPRLRCDAHLHASTPTVEHRKEAW